MIEQERLSTLGMISSENSEGPLGIGGKVKTKFAPIMQKLFQIFSFFFVVEKLNLAQVMPISIR